MAVQEHRFRVLHIAPVTSTVQHMRQLYIMNGLVKRVDCFKVASFTEKFSIKKLRYVVIRHDGKSTDLRKTQ